MADRLKVMGSVAGVVFFVLSVSLCCMTVMGLRGSRPADSYEDKGIHSFVPYRVLPVQVKNTSASGRNRRMNPTRTVYRVYYRDVDGSGYEWKEDAVTKESGQKVVDRGEAVERRVLSVTGESTYITLEPRLDAESYTAGLRRKYKLILGVSAAYIVLYLTVLGAVRASGAL